MRRPLHYMTEQGRKVKERRGHERRTPVPDRDTRKSGAGNDNKNGAFFVIPSTMGGKEDEPVNISLNPHFEEFVSDVLASGRFKSRSEVIREGLRLLEERETRLMALRREIKAGRDSGEPVAYDPDAIKRRGRAALGKRAAG